MLKYYDCYISDDVVDSGSDQNESFGWDSVANDSLIFTRWSEMLHFINFRLHGPPPTNSPDAVYNSMAGGVSNAEPNMENDAAFVVGSLMGDVAANVVNGIFDTLAGVVADPGPIFNSEPPTSFPLPNNRMGIRKR